MGVTRQRDGFRNSSDERSNGAVANRHSYWQGMPQRGANNLRNRSLAAMIFSVPAQRDVAILSYVVWPAKAHVGLRR
jgi:hypothetical protein